MLIDPVQTMSAARQRLGPLAVLAVAAILASCESSGPRTGALKLTVQGLPTGTGAQVTLSGPGNFSRVLTGDDVVASLKPGEYTVAGASVLNGSARYSPTPDTQKVTIAKSDTPVEVTVLYQLTTGSLALTVGGAPEGASPTVRVTGPNGFNQTVTGSTTFEGLDAGTYTIFAQELVANQQRFAPDRPAQSIAVLADLTPTTASVQYAQTTGNLTVSVTGLPAGVTGNISVAGPAASYTVGESSDLVGVRAGSYTVNASIVTSGIDTYIPNSLAQTVTVPAGGAVTVTVIYASSSGPLNLTVDGVTITQVVQTYAGTVPLVAGRDGYIRVFGRANQTNSVASRIRVRLYNGETLVNTMTLDKSAGVPLVPDQAALGSSWNGILVGQFIQPGLRILADIDPDGAVTEASENDNTFPASGTPVAVDVRQVAPLRVTFVPVQQRYDKALVGNITEANKDQFLVDARRLLPVLDIDTEIHAPYTTADSIQLTSNDGNQQWLRVLSEMNALRIAESSQRHYYGIVKVSYNSGVAGYGFVPGRAAVGWDHLPSARGVTAHELTHNFGRFHAPCGGVGGPDPNFPYAGGTIGVYGYDVANNTLKLPSSFDLMGYCSNPWISDYTYVGAMAWRANNPASTVAGAALGIDQNATPRPALLVWGRVERGKLVLEPAFSLVARPSVPAGGGPYRVEGVARNGRTLFSYNFAGDQPADAEDATARHFAFAIPMDEASQAELASIRVTGGGAEPASLQASLAPGGISASVNAVEATTRGGGAVNVRWGGQATRMALVRDRRTGQVLSFARGGSVDVRARSGDLEVVLSDGVRSVARHVKVRAQ
ncbi:MAG TPA: hypothetical protein VFZ21_04640 [Gemmatimonadaceae bacterium]|jgi:hypothetical protein|nr:hypothetical protein [Gemmatimonadaceae bacterium]